MCAVSHDTYNAIDFGTHDQQLGDHLGRTGADGELACSHARRSGITTTICRRTASSSHPATNQIRDCPRPVAKCCRHTGDRSRPALLCVRGTGRWRSSEIAVQPICRRILVKKAPFTPDKVRAISAFLGVDTPTGEVAALYTPLDPQTGTIYQRLLNARDVRTVYADSPDMIAPATDNQPFFNQHARWSSIGWHTISDLFHQGKMGAWRSKIAPWPK